MAFTIAGPAIDPHNGLNTDGLTCDAFNEETWFPSSSPVANTALPGTPDATDTSGPAGNSGQGGHYLMTVPVSGSYWVATYNDWDPTVIAWVKVLSHPHTNAQGWTGYGNTTYGQGQTAIAAASNGVTLPTSSITITGTGWPSTGSFFIRFSGANFQLITYTGFSGSTFSGCTGGTGTLATNQVVFQAIKAGNYRRLVLAMASCGVFGGGTDQAYFEPVRTIGGSVRGGDVLIGISSSPTGGLEAYYSATFGVDPLGGYGLYVVTAGSGTVTAPNLQYSDF